MQEYTNEQTREVYLSLPESLQDVIASVDTAEIIKNIGTKNGLHIDKVGELGREITLVMMGLVKPQDFTLRLERKLLIPTKTAVAITLEVNDKILFKVQNMLRQLGDNPGKTAPSDDSTGEETPTANPKLTSSIFEQKMGGFFSSEKQENKPRANDPYREPIN